MTKRPRLPPFSFLPSSPHAHLSDLEWAIAFSIRIPRVQDLPFLLTPKDWLKLQSPLKTSKKYGFTPEELGHTAEKYGFTPDEFREN